MLWNMDQLKSELKSRKEVKGWAITQETTQRRERYFLGEGKSVAIDQDREVHSQSVDLRLFVDIEIPGRQGEVTKKLFRENSLKSQIDSAIDSAKQTNHQAWSLPTEIPSQIPEVKSCDPKMLEDLNGSMDQVTSEIMTAVARKGNTEFNSSELFMSVHEKELHLSNGLTHRSKQSRMYVEAAYSFSKDGKSDEYLHTAWTVSPSDISVSEIFKTASDRAEASLECTKPLTGKYHVLLDGDVLSTLFANAFTHFTSQSEYLSLPHKKLGDDFIPGATGDLVSMRLDPSLDFGAVTGSMTEQGIVQTPIQLVERNKVVRIAIDKQHGDYLGRKAGTYKGNVVVESGSLDRDQLIHAAPKVLEILQFSGLFVNGSQGTFSSEIRLGKLYDHATGKTTTIKGGSLSGNLFENFKFCRLSKETAKKATFDYGSAAGYFGPKYALISDVSVVG